MLTHSSGFTAPCATYYATVERWPFLSTS